MHGVPVKIFKNLLMELYLELCKKIQNLQVKSATLEILFIGKPIINLIYR